MFQILSLRLDFPVEMQLWRGRIQVDVPVKKENGIRQTSFTSRIEAQIARMVDVEFQQWQEGRWY